MKKKQEKIEVVKCDFCNKPAVYNLQEVWHLYDIDEKGEYTENDTWEGNENNHYCEKHYAEMVG